MRRSAVRAEARPGRAFWEEDEPALLARLASRREGLSAAEAADRPPGAAVLQTPRATEWRLALRQLESPIVLLLIGATVLSMALGDMVDGAIILTITLASSVLGYLQERGAVRAVEDLMAVVRVHADVLRDGRRTEVALDDVVLGDVLLLRAGDVVAGDARVLESDALLVDESALTGESFPAEKRPGVVPGAAGIAGRTNALWHGTNVISGTGTAVVAATGIDTEFSRVAARVTQAHVPTAFEVGLRRFGFLLMRTAGVLVAAIFVANVLLDRPVLESILFSLALAVGLTPQLLPTIVTVTLSHGARQMARRRVIVKRLDAIEDIGAIDVLCTDKTGTLTEGVVQLEAALAADGSASEEVRALGWLNAAYQQGFANPIDAALAAGPAPPGRHRLVDELPYDFTRKLLSVVIERDGVPSLVSKGAFASVIARCAIGPDEESRARQRFQELSEQGFRVLGVATKGFDGPAPETLRPGDEAGLGFAGFLCFSDPPKGDAEDAVGQLGRLGVAVKLITGDNRFAAAHVAAAVGLPGPTPVTGAQLAAIGDRQELERLVLATSVFAEIEPLQKEAIVQALRGAGRTVGYLGDGINDAPSLRAADVGISVDSAVDVAKHSASIVLLDKDLAVLAEAIGLGRQVFANTVKYVRVTISANFGNMVSMAAAALVLPFLPLLPRQILLLNFLSDIPGTTIAADRVDPELIVAPHGWDTRSLRRFMITFGLISSLFDLTTFAALRLGFDAGAATFRTGWLIESTATELAVMLVLRTQRRAWRSRPGTALLVSSVAVAIVTVALPFTALAGDLGLTRPSGWILLTLLAITVAYCGVTEIAKRALARREERRTG